MGGEEASEGGGVYEAGNESLSLPTMTLLELGAAFGCFEFFYGLHHTLLSRLFSVFVIGFGFCFILLGGIAFFPYFFSSLPCLSGGMASSV